MAVGHREVVGARLARRIGRAGIVGRRFGEEARIAQGAVNLVGADVVEEHVLSVLPSIARHIKEGIGADHVSRHEGLGPQDGAVDMALGSEVEDRVGRVLREDSIDGGAIPDVGLLEEVALAPEGFLDGFEALEVPRVGEGRRRLRSSPRSPSSRGGSG